MFLILGAHFCKYCNGARTILDTCNISYHYVDVSEKLTHWKDVFGLTEHVNLGQRSIPLIFQYEANGLEIGHVTAEGLTTMLLDGSLTHLPIGWKFIGGKQELEEIIDNLDITLDDNY